MTINIQQINNGLKKTIAPTPTNAALNPYNPLFISDSSNFSSMAVAVPQTTAKSAAIPIVTEP